MHMKKDGALDQNNQNNIDTGIEECVTQCINNHCYQSCCYPIPHPNLETK